MNVTTRPLAKPDLLTRISRLTPEQWHDLNVIEKWLIVCRAPVLILTLNSVLLAGILSMLNHQFSFIPWLLCTVSLLLAHATNNLLNDYVDYKKGVDTGNYFRLRYGTHALHENLLTPQSFRKYMITTGLGAITTALIVLNDAPIGTWIPFLLGAFFLLFYTWPLKKLGLGELAVWLVWGPLMIAGTDMVMRGSWSWHIAAIGFLFGLGPTTVIFAKHMDKLEFDQKKDVLTLPVRLGEYRSRIMVRTLIITMYLGTLALVLLGWLPVTALLVALALPGAKKQLTQLQQPRPHERPADYPEDIWPLWYVASAFTHSRTFGLLLFMGLLAGLIAA